MCWVFDICVFWYLDHHKSLIDNNALSPWESQRTNSKQMNGFSAWRLLLSLNECNLICMFHTCYDHSVVVYGSTRVPQFIVHSHSPTFCCNYHDTNFSKATYMHSKICWRQRGFCDMLTSWHHAKAFRVTDILWWKSTGHRWIHHKRGQLWVALVFLWC